MENSWGKIKRPGEINGLRGQSSKPVWVMGEFFATSGVCCYKQNFENERECFRNH